MATTIPERVVNLEQMMAQLTQTVEQTSREMGEFKEEMRLSRARSEAEMGEFKEEMGEFKEEMRLSRARSEAEMREFKEEMRLSRARSEAEMREFKEEMGEFKEEMRLSRARSEAEMRDFKEEMGEFKEEIREFTIASRKQWGELSNKLGTMAEDLVAPNIPRVVREIVDCPEETLNSAVRARRRNAAGQRKEFDVVATCGDYLFINETKSSLTPESIRAFIDSTLPTVRDFFPEYADKQIIGIVASLYVDDSLVRYGEKQGLVVLGFGQDLMEVLNSPGFRPKIW